MSEADLKQDESPIPFSVNIKETIAILQKHKDARKMLIALDGTEYSKKAVEWAHKNIVKNDDHVVLVSVWEEAMMEKLFTELDAEIIHPDVDVTKSKHAQLNTTFNAAMCLQNHENLHALLIEAGNRKNPKNVGAEICNLGQQMGVDMIIVGTRGLGALKKAFLGSVSQYISENAHCTCIVVK